MYQAADARYDGMTYNRCGSSGLRLPAVSLGFWHNFGSTGVYETMRKLCFTAFDNGVTHFDLANNYGPEPPLEETMGALDQAVKSGKALYAGLSNYNGQKMQEAAAILRDLKCPFVINQNRYSIFDRTIENNGLKEAAVKEKKGLIAFSPLAQGTLTDRYLYGIPADSRVMTDGRFLKKDQLTEEKISQIRALNEMAGQRGEKLSQMALKWVMKDPVVTSVLIGASKPEQILDNLKMLDGAPLSEEELLKIDQICGIK